VVGEQTRLEIGVIILDWSPWIPWPDIHIANRGGLGVSIPNSTPGVYEVKYVDGGHERLHISLDPPPKF